MAIIEIKNLNFVYNCCEKNALSDINMMVEKGDFAVLCGPSGSGKSTLLSLLNKEIAPYGKTTGDIILNDDICSGDIVFVSQNPFSGTVADKVMTELSFSLEAKKTKPGIIKIHIAEIASYFGLEDIINRDISLLSGGQLQKVKLAAAVIKSPEILILDEPTAQLDPVSTEEFNNILIKLNNDFGTTVILCEHNPEKVYSASTKLFLLNGGRLIFGGNTDDTVKFMNDNGYGDFLPASAKAFFALGSNGNIPYNCRDGRTVIINNKSRFTDVDKNENYSNEILYTVLSVKNIYFRYGKNERDILNGINLTLKKGEALCIFGGNGSGKTTLIRLICGFIKQYSGKITAFGKKSGSEGFLAPIGYLPQRAVDVFNKDTVYEDILSYANDIGYSKADAKNEVIKILEKFNISEVSYKNPTSISGGELQRAALCKILIKKPELLILDEPTKGVDRCEIRNIAEQLISIKKSGVSIIMNTHDAEFAALCGDRAAILFDGKIVYSAEIRELLNFSTVYTTGFSLLTREIVNGCITFDDFLRSIGDKNEN